MHWVRHTSPAITTTSCEWVQWVCVHRKYTTHLISGGGGRSSSSAFLISTTLPGNKPTFSRSSPLICPAFLHLMHVLHIRPAPTHHRNQHHTKHDQVRAFMSAYPTWSRIYPIATCDWGPNSYSLTYSIYRLCCITLKSIIEPSVVWTYTDL